jgi:hypothetical protein
VNASRGKTPEVDWRSAFSHILVGGQAMDRGFTVEGLTVTYMPRGVGVGNADTVQQRARFFGYKKHYLGYCRVFLESIVRDAYHHYVEHEEDIRKQLIIHKAKEKPLSEWKRAFFLHTKLKPTRNNVLDLPYMRGNFSDIWYAPKGPHDSEEASKANHQIIANFLANLALQPDPGHKQRTLKQRHLIATNVPLQKVYERLLTQIRVTRPSDSQQFVGLLIQIHNYLELHKEELCTIYVLSRGMNPTETRERKVDDKGDISNLFQGAYPENSGEVYLGDRYIRAEKGVTVHIHYLEVTKKNNKGNKEVIAHNVPTVTVWIPREMAASWYVQKSIK